MNKFIKGNGLHQNADIVGRIAWIGAVSDGLPIAPFPRLARRVRRHKSFVPTFTYQLVRQCSQPAARRTRCESSKGLTLRRKFPSLTGLARPIKLLTPHFGV